MAPDTSGERPSSRSTDRYTRDKRAIVGWVGATFGATALVIAGWAHGKISSHDTNLAVHEHEIRTIKEAVAEQKLMLREILAKMTRIP